MSAFHHQTRGPVVAVAGDWEGNGTWAMEKIRAVGESGVDVMLHAGDFGIRSDRNGKRYLRAVELVAAAYDMTIYVTPGNHEDWARLDMKRPKVRNDMGPLLWMSDHVAVLPRGHRFSLLTPAGTDRSFVSLGGAPSINFETCTRGRDWWPEEMITNDHVDHVVAGGYADVMLTHDAPLAPYETDAVAAIRTYNPQGWSGDALAYARVGAKRLTRAFEGVSPRMLIHGHFHVYGVKAVELPDGRSCTVLATGGERTTGNITRLDVDSLTLP